MRIDKNKVYAFIGKVVVYGTGYVGAVVFSVWAFMQNTIYQEEQKMDKLDKSYIWHQVMLAKLKLRVKECKEHGRKIIRTF